ncbi:hypothetical protein B1207_06300 [Legionella quinlivanii]|uniref:Uncharacterized protein n=1 Tax=Legionella quinlivanii TaxID=45073 RepID=A0A364LKA2_9GAMM|nr:hypothetical protein [Legionella quinlivanii]RAP37032.1 hypothetical protein B1207_06300 [Legionella quinlivanii]
MSQLRELEQCMSSLDKMVVKSRIDCSNMQQLKLFLAELGFLQKAYEAEDFIEDHIKNIRDQIPEVIAEFEEADPKELEAIFKEFLFCIEEIEKERSPSPRRPG